MALYEYLCPACRKGFEMMRPMSDANKGAACPACGSEAQRAISGSPGVEGPTEAPTRPSWNDSETGSPDSESEAANQRSGMIPASDLEGSTGPHGVPSGGSVREDLDSGSSVGTALHAPMAVREDVAADSEFDLQGDTAPLDMPWLTESQPGGGNLWFIRDWGIASMFGYLRGKRATEPVGELPSPVAGPADGAGSHPTFSEWRTAISIMPWLQDTGIESSEAGREDPDVAREDPGMPGPRPRRDRGTARLAWAGWLGSQPAGENAADPARRSRPAREGSAADFPAQVIEAAWRRQGGRCAGCGRWLIRQHRDRDSGTGAWESHHRVPVDRGGSHLLGNCVLFCSGVADCHFNLGHGGIGWTHYAPLDESALLFIFSGSTTARVPATPVRPKRSLLRGVLGIPQVGRERGKPPDGSGGPDSTG